MKERSLTPKQLRFVQEYIADLNATQAAIRAGYSRRYADDYACQLLRKSQVRAAISDRQANMSKTLEITAEQAIQEVARCAFLDIRCLFDVNGRLKSLAEWPDDAAHAVASIEHMVGHGGQATVIKIRLHDKLHALNILAKHFGLFRGQEKELAASAPTRYDLSRLTDEELELFTQLRDKCRMDGNQS
jgi:phage terminase small subunit